MLKSGDQIGQFILLNKIGSGGFGDVWKAEKRTALDSNYFALKFFRPKDERIDFDKIGKELAVWKQLKGLPHIISVIELDQFEDYVYVVSDFADGGSLEKWLQNNGGKVSSQAEAVKITLEILRGLENLHDKGFVHRDLKPDNILIMNGRYCLADFGISREIKTHSKTTGTAGTMEYMPPEAFESKPLVTPQTDIWAVGVILQKLLTGELPYPQQDSSSLLRAILFGEPDEMPESISEGLREIVKKALQKQSANRFQTAREMRETLKNPEQFLAERARKIKDSETIIDEDFDKTALLEVPVTKDWREIEAEKQRQREKEQSKIEKERIKREKVEQQQLEGEKLQREVQAKSIQSEREENFRKQKGEGSKELEKQEKYKRTAKNRSNGKGIIWVGIGGFGASTLLIYLLYFLFFSHAPDSVPNFNSVNNTDNKPIMNFNSRMNSNMGMNSNGNLLSKSASDYFNIAYDCGKKENYDCAIKNYTKAIELEPGNADAYNNRGNAYNNKGKYDQAIQDYRKALEIDPNVKHAKDGLVLALERKGTSSNSNMMPINSNMRNINKP